MTQFAKDMFRAQQLLIATNQAVSKTNLAKIYGCSNKTISRNLLSSKLSVKSGILESSTDSPGRWMSIGQADIRSISPTNIGTLPDNQLLLCSLLLPCLDDVSSVDLSTTSVSTVLSVLAIPILLEHKFLHPNSSFDTNLAYAESIIGYYQAAIFTDGSVPFDNKHLRWLLRNDGKGLFTKLIVRGGSYKKGLSTKESALTPLMENVVAPAIVDLFLRVDVKSVRKLPTDLLLTPTHLRTVNSRDILLLLNNTVGSDGSGGYVINYRDTEIDKQFSRKYNIFTALKSDSRKKLDYINYDISAALQAIVFNFIDVNPYPEHKKLVADKHTFRASVAAELGSTVKDVKTYLTAADNGKQYNSLKLASPILTAYIEESSDIADKFIAHIKGINPTMYRRANKFAKPIFKRVVAADGSFSWKPIKGSVNKYSLFFFIWTQVERETRNAMMTCFQNKSDIREVHDAVYSKEVVEVAAVEQAILDHTGLVIKIEVG